MESKDLIIIVCAIIVGACIIAGAIYITNSSDESNMTSTNCNASNLNNNTTTLNDDSQSSKSHVNSNSKSDVVSEEIKYNYQNDGGYYKEITYSDGGFRQYDTESGKLIGSSYSSDSKYLPTME